jgi:DNA-binding FadR family transcriptional regulator
VRKPSTPRARAAGAHEPGKQASAKILPKKIMLRSGIRRMRRALKISELIARDIILDISEGGLKAGDSLPPEAAMLQQYAVGRASLREALRLLEVQGLVHIRAGAKGGPVVGAATAENLARMLTLYFGVAGATYQDLADVMLLLYPKVAGFAAARKLERAEIVALNASIEQSCSTPDPRLLRTETLKDFHSLLTQFGKNFVWSLLTDAVGLIFAEDIIATTDSREFHATAIEDHRQIAEAVLAQNPALAQERMLDHTRKIIKFYRSQTPRIFSQLIQWG